jgi:ribosomal protein S18 acetylase RimI-like enzyme
VSNTEIEIRRLSPVEAAVYRTLRLEALRTAPAAYSSTYAFEHDQPLSWFADRLTQSTVFGALIGDDLVGIAAFVAKQGEKEKHKGLLVGMYVRPSARRRGIGRLLAAAVIDHARSRVEILLLSVIAGNDAARRLYASLGFAAYGVEKNALKQNGRYWDDVLMALPLTLHEAAA